MSISLQTALICNKTLSTAWIFVAPTGLHFSLLYTKKRKLLEQAITPWCLYLPGVFFVVITFLSKNGPLMIPSEFWGWVYMNNQDLFSMESYWMASLMIPMVVFLFRYAAQQSVKNEKGKQAMIIAVGFAVPIVQGIITELVYPVLTGSPAIPVTSSFLTFSSIATVVALKRYGLFNLSESLSIHSILDTLTDVVIVLSPSGELRFINRKGTSIFGLNHKQTTRINGSHFFTKEKDAFKQFKSNLLIPVLSGKQVLNYFEELTTPHGRNISALISATRMERKNAHDILLLIRDVTDHTETQKELTRNKADLLEKNKDLETFFYRITHDLKGPIASTLGLINVAHKDIQDSCSLTYLDMIKKNTQKINAILHDFMSLLYINRRERKYSPVNINSEIHGTIQQLSHLIDFTKIHFQISVSIPNNFYSDAYLIRIILHHLLENAILYKKRAPENSLISITAEYQASGAKKGMKLLITDNGIGMDNHIREKIFDAFYRGTTLSTGNGLGLHIVRNAVSILKGEIFVTSKKEVGSEFSIFIPSGQDSNSTRSNGSTTDYDINNNAIELPTIRATNKT